MALEDLSVGVWSHRWHLVLISWLATGEGVSPYIPPTHVTSLPHFSRPLFPYTFLRHNVPFTQLSRRKVRASTKSILHNQTFPGAFTVWSCCPLFMAAVS